MIRPELLPLALPFLIFFFFDLVDRVSSGASREGENLL